MRRMWQGAASPCEVGQRSVNLPNLPSGDKTTVTQTERIGPFLDGSVKVIEGRGYDVGGVVKFNAFGTISYNLGTRAYTLHSYAQGNVGDFVFEGRITKRQVIFPTSLDSRSLLKKEK